MDHWHADETRWLVFVSLPDKSGHRWYLWAFQSEAVVVFVLDPGRAHDVPEEHLGAAATGILNVDRYSAYQALPQVKNGRILLAFCWAHQRRDFLGVAADWPTEQAWALAWVTAIGELYHLNDRRLELREDSEAFHQRDQDPRGRGRFPAALASRRGGVAPAPSATPSAGESAGTLARTDVVRGVSRDPDGQQRRGADVA